MVRERDGRGLRLAERHPARLDLADGIQDVDGFDQLSAEDAIHPLPRRVLQSVDNALATDRRVFEEPAATAWYLRGACPGSQHGCGLRVEIRASLSQLNRRCLRLHCSRCISRH